MLTQQVAKMSKAYDVVVCGCGSAGFCAAVAAARNGARVAVIEKYSTPGGILTVLGSNAIDQFNNPFRKTKKMIVGGIAQELVSRLHEENFAFVPDMDAPYREHSQYSVKVNPVATAKIMDDMLIEAGVDIYYDQPIVEAIVSENEIKHVLVATKDGLLSVSAKIFIDCTGDGDLAHLAGAKTQSGDANGKFQPGTLRYYPAISGDPDDKVLNFGDNKNHVSIDTTSSDGITQAQIAARRMMYAQMQANARIMACAPSVAPREGRRIKGVCTMKVEDYFSGKQYFDSVCYTFWFVDIHREGQAAQIRYIKHENTPSVRLSAMISADLANLMMAGRCISTDRETNSAIRVKASCMAMGQAAGTAAAIAALDNASLTEINIDRLKKTLAGQNAIVPGISDGEEIPQSWRK